MLVCVCVVRVPSTTLCNEHWALHTETDFADGSGFRSFSLSLFVSPLTPIPTCVLYLSFLSRVPQRISQELLSAFYAICDSVFAFPRCVVALSVCSRPCINTNASRVTVITLTTAGYRVRSMMTCAQPRPRQAQHPPALTTSRSRVCGGGFTF